MFRKLTLSAALVLAAVAGARALPSAPAAQPVEVVALNQAALPASSSPLTSAAPSRVQLAPAQMQQAQGEGWLKKLFKKFKKLIRKIIDVIIDYLLDQLFSETNTWVPTQAGDVTETHESTETTTSTYTSQTAYDTNTPASTTYEDTGWQFTGASYGGGCSGLAAGGSSEGVVDDGGVGDGSVQYLATYDQMAMDVAC